MTWQAFLGALVGAAVVALVVLVVLNRRTKRHAACECIAAEQKETREALRRLAVELVSETGTTPKEDIRNEIILRLNPYDEVDNKLVELMNEIISQPGEEEPKNRFIYTVQCMLKYDWERTREQAGLSKKHGEIRRIAKEIAAAITSSQEVEKLRLRLGANRELPEAPREFTVPEKKEETLVRK